MTPPPAQPPLNVLLLLTDQWRWDWLGSFGSDYGRPPVRTPHLATLAAAGTHHTCCRTNSPLCGPARACLATGLRYGRHRVRGNKEDLPDDADTFVRRLRDAGYRTATCGKSDLRKTRPWKGLDGWTAALGRLGFTQAADSCGKWDAINAGTKHPTDPSMRRLHEAGLAATHAADYARRFAQERDTGRIAHWPSPLPPGLHTDDACSPRPEQAKTPRPGSCRSTSRARTSPSTRCRVSATATTKWTSRHPVEPPAPGPTPPASTASRTTRSSGETTPR